MFGKKEIETLKEENNLLKQENEKLKGSYGVSKSKELKEEIAIYREEEEKLNDLIEVETKETAYDRFYGDNDYTIKKLKDIKNTLQGENKDE